MSKQKDEVMMLFMSIPGMIDWLEGGPLFPSEGVQPLDTTDYDTQEPVKVNPVDAPYNGFFSPSKDSSCAAGCCRQTAAPMKTEEVIADYEKLRHLLTGRPEILPGCPLIVDEVAAQLKAADQEIERLRKKLDIADHETKALYGSLESAETRNGELARRLTAVKMDLIDYVRESRDRIDGLSELSELMDEIEASCDRL